MVPVSSWGCLQSKACHRTRNLSHFMPQIILYCLIMHSTCPLPVHATGKSLANPRDVHAFLLSLIIILLKTSTTTKVFPGYKLTTCRVTKMLAQNFKHIPLLSYVSNFILRNNVTWVIISFEFTVWRIRAQKYPQVQQLPCFPRKEKKRKECTACLPFPGGKVARNTGGFIFDT